MTSLCSAADASESSRAGRGGGSALILVPVSAFVGRDVPRPVQSSIEGGLGSSRLDAPSRSVQPGAGREQRTGVLERRRGAGVVLERSLEVLLEAGSGDDPVAPRGEGRRERYARSMRPSGEALGGAAGGRRRR
jgi:hypothetical protein